MPVSFQVKSQDPFANLEKKAKTQIFKKTIGKNLVDENIRVIRSTKSSYSQPFTFKDKNGKPIDPNSDVTLQNGKNKSGSSSY